MKLEQNRRVKISEIYFDFSSIRKTLGSFNIVAGLVATWTYLKTFVEIAPVYNSGFATRRFTAPGDNKSYNLQLYHSVFNAALPPDRKAAKRYW